MVLASGTTIGLAGLAGCLGLVGMDEHAAEPAGVDPEVLDSTGYDVTGVEELGIEESVSLVVYDETVVVRNYLTEHEKGVDMGPLLGTQRGAVFMLLTTPQVSVLGQELNPIGDMDTAELVELVEENYDDISDITHDADDEIDILDQSVTQSRFSADARFDGVDVDVFLHITEAVEYGDDLLVAIGVYPEQVRSQEEENVLELMRGVIEDAEIESGSANGDGSENGDDGDDGDDDGDDSDDDDGIGL